MLAELQALLRACPPDTDRAGYLAAVVGENVLLKSRLDTRKKSFRILTQLYALDGRVLLFRALRDLWDAAGEQGQPLLAVLCALARDPPFRALDRQPMGWEPDLDDGVRLNIRPFVTAGVLRARVNVKWGKDRGANPDGSERLNDLHYTIAEKLAARTAAGASFGKPPGDGGSVQAL